MNSYFEKFLIIIIVFLVLLLGVLAFMGINQNKIDFLSLFKSSSENEIPPQVTTQIKPITIDKFEETAKNIDTAQSMVFDLREPTEYQKGHLAGAYNLPYSVIQDGNFDLPKQNIEIILYTGENTNPDTNLLKEKLSQKQIPSVEIISNPYEQWKDKFEQAAGNPRMEENSSSSLPD